jgi:hypothetical protein
MTRRCRAVTVVAGLWLMTAGPAAHAGASGIELVLSLPTCPGGTQDITGYLGANRAFFEAFPRGQVSFALLSRSKLLVYVGHAYEENGQTKLCTAGTHQIAAELLGPVPAGDRVLAVLDACHSAYVDVRRGDGAAAAISASDMSVDARGGFGGFGAALQVALGDLAGTDTNCDGLVTDVELFRRIEAILTRQLPLVRFRPRPRLRSQSDTPIPIARIEARPDCSGHEAVARASALGGELAAAIDTQRKIADGATPPKIVGPFYRVAWAEVIRSHGEAGAEELRLALAGAGLKEVPAALTDSDLSSLARHLFATEVYRLGWVGRWLSVERVGDDVLAAMRRVVPGGLKAALTNSLPGPVSVLQQEPLLGRPGARLLVRYRGRAPAAFDKVAERKVRPGSVSVVACPTPLGQCFSMEVE